jgi:hypothetical protein
MLDNLGYSLEAMDTDDGIDIGDIMDAIRRDMVNNPADWPTADTLLLSQRLNSLIEDMKKQERRRASSGGCL